MLGTFQFNNYDMKLKQFSVASVIGFHDSRRDEMQEFYYCHSPQNSDEIKAK